MMMVDIMMVVVVALSLRVVDGSGGVIDNITFESRRVNWTQGFKYV